MTDTTLSIPAPRRDRPPLHANIFDVLIGANTALIPLFPYLHPGAMVAGGAIFQGGPDADYGTFYHTNTQNEVSMAIASNGGLLATGQVFVGADSHGVNSFLKDEKDPSSLATFIVTQVQSETGIQREGISTRCSKCSEEVFRREFDAVPGPDATVANHMFLSVAALPAIFGEYNSDEKLRTCAACGHVNRTFPVKAWGWDKYTDQYRQAAAARQLLLEAGASVTK